MNAAGHNTANNTLVKIARVISIFNHQQPIAEIPQRYLNHCRNQKTNPVIQTPIHQQHGALENRDHPVQPAKLQSVAYN